MVYLYCVKGRWGEKSAKNGKNCRCSRVGAAKNRRRNRNLRASNGNLLGGNFLFMSSSPLPSQPVDTSAFAPPDEAPRSSGRRPVLMGLPIIGQDAPVFEPESAGVPLHGLGCACCAPTVEPTAATSSRGAALLGRLDRGARSEWALFAGAIIGALGFLIALGRDTAAGHNEVSMPFYVAVVILGGWPLLRGAMRAWSKRSLDMNLLMSAAVIGAGALSEWGEAAALVWLYALANRVEERSLSRARNAISSLLSLAPARVLRRNHHGDWTEVDASLVRIGEHFLTRAGERVALDGELLSPHAQLDESPVTGESLPVEKRVGDAVLAGTLNVGDALEARATRVASQGTAARIARLVEEAGANASPRQRATERFAKRYTPLVFAAAILVAVVPPLFLRAGWHDSIYRALALLVAACPCAFVLSGPVATWCALAALSRRGVLARGGASLEALAAAKTFAFDKTGTLTRGAPVVTAFEMWPDCDLNCAQLLAIAAGLETRSTHPLARAVLDLARAQNVTAAPVSDSSERRGVGVSGVVAGQKFRIERVDDCGANECGARDGAAWEKARELRAAGQSLALLSREIESATGDEARDAATPGESALGVAACEPLALFAFADELRPEAREALQKLGSLGVKSTVILSGDHPNVVASVAQSVGATAWRADLTPADKLDAIRELEAQGGAAMVGDGINDAPALAGASVGIAIARRGENGETGAASDIALEAAGITLLRADLRALPDSVQLARRTHRIIATNIALALGLKGGFVTGVLLGWWGQDYLVGGVISDVGASLLVTLNALRLLRN